MELPESRAGFVHRIGGFSGRTTSMDRHRHVGGEVEARTLGTVARGRPEQAEPSVRGGKRNGISFEEKLRRFLKESKEHQDELKRNGEAKLGRARRR